LYVSHFACGYEAEVGTLLYLLIPDDGVFIDVGSNWGYFPLFVASRPGFHGLIHAFEPFPTTFEDLQSVIKQARLTNRIKTHQVAHSDQVGRTSMRLPDFTSSGLATIEKDMNRGQHGGISLGRLDDLETRSVSVIKIDVEGMESSVLRGGLKLLSQHSPFVILENTRSFSEPQQTLEPLRILQKLGYEFFQPGWFEQESFAIGGDFWSHEVPKESFKLNKLLLAPFSVTERFLRQPHMNVLACHQSKSQFLKSLFLETITSE
jgi:FkbM family methyltransferase